MILYIITCLLFSEMFVDRKTFEIVCGCLFTIFLSRPVDGRAVHYIENTSVAAHMQDFGMVISETTGANNFSVLDVCRVAIHNKTYKFVRHVFDAYDPNFIRFSLRFRYLSNSSVSVSQTPDVIRPYDWVWTHEKPDGYVPYLKWPANFGFFSFGMLDVKSLPQVAKPYVVLQIMNKNCSLRLWDNKTTEVISAALATLVPGESPYANYFCYLKETPNIKSTLQYKLGVHIGYPVEFVRYNCCLTQDQRVASEHIRCRNQIPKMWQVIELPFIIGLFIFAYFFPVLFSVSGKLMELSKNYRPDFQRSLILNASRKSLQYEYIFKDANKEMDIVYLDGAAPVQFTAMLCGLCGMSEKYPVAVSRLRRLLFVVAVPVVIFTQLYIYATKSKDYVLALIDHGCPLGYTTMLAGHMKSKAVFLPLLGGPYVVLMMFYIAGLLFIVLPARPDIIVHVGSFRYTQFGEISPLLLDLETVDSLSPYRVLDSIGYDRVSTLSRAMFYMIANPKFWVVAVNIQLERMTNLKTKLHMTSSIWIVLVPLYFIVCLLELSLCIIYYGIPIINSFAMIITGYVVETVKHFGASTQSSCINRLPRVGVAFLVLGLFVYFICSFSTIFLSSFYYLARMVVFSFMAVLIYPTESFGYFFFIVVFIYYIFKVWEKFGQVYFELLADAVEICHELETSHQRYQNSGDVISMDIQQMAADRQSGKNSCDSSASRQLIFKKDNIEGIQRDLFQVLVKQYRPVYKHAARSTLKIIMILALIAVTVSIVLEKGEKSSEGLSEMMHVMFIIVIGALPRLLEMAFDTINHSVRKDIEMRRMKETVLTYLAKEHDNLDIKS